jgi:hypothetical protein
MFFTRLKMNMAVMKHVTWTIRKLRDIVSSIVGDAAVLYTTDGAAPSYLKCGKVDGVYATVDFGTSKKLFYGICAAGWHPRPLHLALQHNEK